MCCSLIMLKRIAIGLTFTGIFYIMLLEPIMFILMIFVISVGSIWEYCSV